MHSFHFKKVAVYCASNAGKDGEFKPAAEQLATTLAQAGLTLIYGGAKVGMMGQLADGLLRQGGTVIGVRAQALVNKELAHEGLSAVHRVPTMHEKKSFIAEQADAFILFPGGPGSWEE